MPDSTLTPAAPKTPDAATGGSVGDGGLREADAPLARFDHHPNPSTDFCIEVEALQGWSVDMRAGRRSQWPFWGRLSRLLRFIKSPEFAALDEIAQRAKPIVLGLEQSAQERLPEAATLTLAAPKTPDAATGGSVGDEGLREEVERLHDALELILPMAKGYAAAHPVGANARKIEHAEAVLEVSTNHVRRAPLLREALAGIADDYMTSEEHHPGYVLIPTAKFEELRALGSAPVGEDEAVVRGALHRAYRAGAVWASKNPIHADMPAQRAFAAVRYVSSLAPQPPKAETPAGVGEPAYRIDLVHLRNHLQSEGATDDADAITAALNDLAALSAAPAARHGHEVVDWRQRAADEVEGIANEWKGDGRAYAMTVAAILRTGDALSSAMSELAAARAADGGMDA